MARLSTRDPKWVDAILDWRWTWLTARIALTSAYIVGGLTKLLDFPGAIAEEHHFGLWPAPVWAVASIIVELGGPVLIIWGRWVWLGAGGLGVLTAVAAYVAQPFWLLQDHARLLAIDGFTERAGLIAGFVLAALLAEQEQREAARR